jgi:hypothetical protein
MNCPTYAVGEDAAPSYDQGQDLPAYVAFTDVPMQGIYGGTTCIVIEVPKKIRCPTNLEASPAVTVSSHCRLTSRTAFHGKRP